MQKQFIFLGMIVGSIVGGYMPELFGVSLFSFTSIFTGALGAFIGIDMGYKIGQNLNTT